MKLAIDKAVRVILLTVGLAGCGGAPEAVVTGTVLVDGELAERGQVAFYPESNGPPALATIREDGSFAIAVGRGDKINPDKSKIVAGAYAITVTVNGPNVPDEDGGPPAIGPRISHEKYANRTTSPLRQSIVDGRNIVVLELDRAPPAEPTEADNEREDAGLETQSETEEPADANAETQDPATPAERETADQEVAVTDADAASPAAEASAEDVPAKEGDQ